MRSLVLLLFFGAILLCAYEPVHQYDPSRDASRDIAEAVAEAARTDRRVLVEVGGEWCIWCHILDDFWTEHSEVTEFREANYVMVKVNFSPANENTETLSRYPEVEGYPHFFVLGSDGSLLRSQGTGELESGKKHSKKKVFNFLKTWAPHR